MERQNLTSLAYGIAVATAIILGAFIALSMMARQEFERAREDYINLTGTVGLKEAALEEARTALGVAGLSGLIERYLGSRDAIELNAAKNKLVQINRAVRTMRAQKLNAEELRHVGHLNETLSELAVVFLDLESKMPAQPGGRSVLIADLRMYESDLVDRLTGMSLLQRSARSQVQEGLSTALEATRQFIAIGALFIPFIIALALGVVWFAHRLLSAIGERDEAQEKLTEINRDLERIVGERTEDLARSNTSLMLREKELRDMANALPILLSYVGADGRFKRVNRAYLKLFECEEVDIVGRRAIDLWPAENHPRIEPVLTRVLAGETLSEVLSITGLGERTLHLSAEFVPDIGEDGVVRGYYAALQDVSRQKVTEAALIKATEDAIQANNSKSLFLAHMSHELRTPLNAIIGFSEVMVMGLFGDLSERYQRYSSDVHQSAKHLLSLINDLLDLSRIEAGRFDLNECNMDFEEVIEEINVILHPIVQGSGVSLELENGPPIGLVYADRRALFQVFLNVLTNAVKFSPANSVVRLTKRRSDIGDIVISIEDQGSGISPQDLENILEPFVRGANAMVASAEGSGLGLPLAAAFVREHGGILDIKSKLGRGTVVSVTLPAYRVRKSMPSDRGGDQQTLAG